MTRLSSSRLMTLDEIDSWFYRCYRGCKSAVSAVIVPLAGPAADVEALTQETFERFYRG